MKHYADPSAEALEILRGAEQQAESAPPEETPIANAIMPTIVYHGLAGRFVDALQYSTEAPREFRLAAFLTIAAALIGRRAWVTYSLETFPNLFTLLVGQTASARKTTVMSHALKLMAAVVDLTQEKVKPLYGLASVEGLAAAMKDGDSPDPFRVIIVEDELKSLLRKAQQKGVSNLVPRLTELYNCGRSFEVNTKTDRAVIKNPFACVVSGSTPAWFCESIGDSEISGGFLNRWTMFTGGSDALIPFPKAPDASVWDSIVEALAEVVQRSRGAYALDPEAQAIFSDFYVAFRSAKDDGLRTEATARTDLHAIKFALLYAILDDKTRIEAEDITRGIALATFNQKVAMSVIEPAGLSRMAAGEQKLLTIVRSGRVSSREAMRRLHLSAEELGRMARALERVGLIELETEVSVAGRRRVFLRAE